ncbi:Mfa1 family fimbria major subunit [Bacteroides sp. 519]|uniref:Mfa1 family fimbria major subunit n=1 Tax=Bacteroides sp. 519 TaxID=2302937 RepID=UPI0013D8CFAD|nr:Mfa1 family fimbria major subunit [Bacteroides sp. 519]
MKMNFKYAMMAAAISLGFASCSNDPVADKDPIVDAQEAYISFKVKQAGEATRAVSRYIATDEEKAVYTSKVYVFNSNKVLQQIVDLDVNSTNDGAEKIFKTTVGNHYFLAVANEPVIPVALGTSLDNLVEVVNNLNMAKFSTFLDPCDGDGNFTGKTGTGFFMTSGVNVDEGTNRWYKTIDYWEQEIVAAKDPATSTVTVADIDPKNRVVVPIGRAMGKTVVTMDASKYDVKNDKGEVLGKIETPEYALANNPDDMYYFPFFGTLQRFQTPQWTNFNKTTAPQTYWPALHAADFGDVSVYGEYGVDAINEVFGYRNVPTKPAHAMSGAEITESAFYVVENTNEVPTYGNATIAQVKTKFVPDAAAWEDAAVTGTFYRVWLQHDATTGDGEFVTKTKQGFWGSKSAIYAAYGVADDAGLKALDMYINEYTDGYCWYMIPLRNTYLQPNDTDKQRNNDAIVYSVMRNHFYDVTVNSITDCGYPGPGGKNIGDPDQPGPGDETDPTDPLDPEGTPFIHVSIEVKDWVWVSQGEDLGIRD